MKKAILIPWIILCACTAQKLEPFGQLAGHGSNGLLQVGDWVFIVSSAGNELKVLDVSLESPDFLRAPNPLEPLSIPVLERPTHIASDKSFQDMDRQPYVYVTSAGAREISIVSTDRDGVGTKEIQRWVADAPVTAVAGRWAPQMSELFWTTYDGANGALFRMALPEAKLLKESSLEMLKTAAVKLADMPGVFVRSILVLPGNRLAVAAQKEFQDLGYAWVWDFSQTPFSSTTLGFPFPVVQLVTYGDGARIFGVLDSSSCSSDECRGVLGVEALTGRRLEDVRGAPMMPIRRGQALIQSLAVSDGLEGPTKVANQTLGAMTTTSGEILFFDALELRDIDLNSEAPSVESLKFMKAPVQGESEVRETEFRGGPQNLVLADGAARSEVVKVTYNAFIPGLEALAVSSQGPSLQVADELTKRIRKGDLIRVTTSEGVCFEGTVSSIETSFLNTTEVLPEKCLLKASFSVVAAGDEPFVVAGSVAGFMGRVGPGQTFVFEGNYFHHSDEYVPLAPKPQMTFVMGPLEAGMSSLDEYVLTLESGFSQAVTSAKEVVASGRPQFRFPGALQLDAQRQRAYVSYPSADAVLLFSPSAGASDTTALLRK